MQHLFHSIAGALLCAAAAPAHAQNSGADTAASARTIAHPTEGVLKRAGSTSIDLRKLPHGKVRQREKPEREPPDVTPVELPPAPQAAQPPIASVDAATATAPAPLHSYAGLDFANWGSGYPSDTNADVGPTYIIEAVNTSIGVFDKASGTRVAAFTFDTLMSQGAFGNLCDTDNFGDPIVVYDTFEDRWIISDFAFQLDGGNNVVYPPGSFECFAVSKTGDPVGGGWNFYSINTSGGLGDYPKLGVWPDGLYLSVNMYDYAFGGQFQNPRLYAFNKAQMYAGAPTVQMVSFDAPPSEFTMLPANARVQTGTPPAGSPNYFTVVWNYLNAVSVYAFHVDWNNISTSTLTGPFTSTTTQNWSIFGAAGALTPGNTVDVLSPRLMAQNRYANIGGVESLWNSHTVGASGVSSTRSGVRWYQVNITGGSVQSPAAQALTLNFDSLFRFNPSIGVDRLGNMAIEYNVSSATVDPAIRYAGHLAGDSANSISQTENSLIEGAGSQTVSTRWGDYSSLSLDPDGCTFWFANQYYAVDGGNWQTRIGAMRYPGCTAPLSGGIQGTITASAGGGPIWNATVSLGSRTTTTDGSGAYAFGGLAPGTYPSLSVSAPGYGPASASGVAVSAGAATTENFALSLASTGTCRTDTSQADFQGGAPTNVDLLTTPGSAQLARSVALDQHADPNSGPTGSTFDTANLLGQTFTAGASGNLTRVDAQIFCAGIPCSGNNPNMILELRNTSGGLPVMNAGGLIASSTIAGSSNTNPSYFTFPFATAPTLASGTQYGLVIRLSANRTGGGQQAWLYSSGNVYAGGIRVNCTTSACSLPSGSNANSDFIFKTFIRGGFLSAGDQISSTADANPAPGSSANWTSMSWNAITPASTQLQFQVAGSNAPYGPFAFVGPDGTNATYFTGGTGSLAQFAGKRYLQYRAYFTTSDTSATPVLSDATVCFSNTAGGPVADLSITNSDGVSSVTPGTQIVYTIKAANAGPSSANGATVIDAFPSGLTCNWTCSGANSGSCTASGSGNISDSGTSLPGGASITYTATCSVASSATGSLVNIASIAAPGGVLDLMTGNDSATDTDSLTPAADLSITLDDGVATAAPGGSVTYTIEATNNGPSDAPSTTVADAFPSGLTCNWTCSGTGGGSCSAGSGSGSINDTGVNLPSSASVTFTAHCAISATANGSLVDSATVTAAAGITDGVAANNSATDTDTLVVQADVAVTLSDHQRFARTGDVLDYIIDVTNPVGPSPAAATVSDTLPAELLGGTWTCTPTGGANCGNGSGNALSDIATVPVGGKASYLYSATVLAGDGTIVNTATVSLNAGNDPVSANNSATDSDTIVIFADGFDGNAALAVSIESSDSGYVAARLTLDPALVARLGIVPVEVANGSTADGRPLFALHVARFGASLALRLLTTDAAGNREVSPWHTIGGQRGLLQFVWQSASADKDDGFVAVGDGGPPLRLDHRSARERPQRIVIPTDGGTPWLIAVEQ